MTAPGFEPNDMMGMQQEAIRRVQEMQERARRTMGLDPENAAAPPPMPEPPQGFTPPMPDPGPELPTGAPPSKPKQDHEKTLITLLLLILMAENASPELIFSLLYLL